jgi:hypothetical protein
MAARLLFKLVRECPLWVNGGRRNSAHVRFVP